MRAMTLLAVRFGHSLPDVFGVNVPAAGCDGFTQAIFEKQACAVQLSDKACGIAFLKAAHAVRHRQGCARRGFDR